MQHERDMPTESWNKDKMPVLAGFRSGKLFIVTTVCVASFSDAFIYGVIIPVLPYSLKDRLGVPEENIQFWNSTLLASFGLAQLIGSPFFGYFADKSSSRRTPLLLGFFSNAAATALLYLAPNLWMLALSRFLQGLSAAVVYTVGFALLEDTVGSENIGQWMGFVISSLNMGMLISPSLGGIIYARAGYGSLFIVMFSLIAIDICLRLVMIEKKTAMRWQHPSPHEEPAITNGQPESSGRGRSIESHPGDPLLGPKKMRLNVSNDKSHPLPLITLLKSARVLTDLYGVFITVTLLTSFDAALPVFTERQFDWGPTRAGLIFLTVTCPIFAAPLAGRLSDKYPSRWFTAVGFLVSAGFTVLLLLVRHNNTEQIILLCTLLTLYGFARVFSSTPLGADLSRAVAGIERDQPGIFGKSGASAQVFSLYTSASAAGVLAGPAWTSFAYGNRSWTFFVSSLGLLSASVTIPLLLFTDTPSQEHVNAREDV